MESRLRQLTLKIERDTNGMLQCHPYPHEYTDTSRPCSHCAFFMGLQRKEGVRGQEGQQFDIRGTVDEFRQEVNMYMFWKPGMDIYVSHVRRKQLPTFVFPDGYKRPRLSRHVIPQAKKTCEDTVGCQPCANEKKRINDFEAVDVKLIRPEKRAAIGPQRLASLSPENNTRRSGGVGIECLRTGVTNLSSEVGPSGELLESEKHSGQNDVGMVQNSMQESVSLKDQGSTCVSNLLGQVNEVKLGELMDRMESDVSSEASVSELKETHQVGLDGKRVGNLALVDTVSVKTAPAGRILNWTEGAVDVDRDIVKPCNQTTMIENAESTYKSNSSVKNLNCEVSFSL